MSPTVIGIAIVHYWAEGLLHQCLRALQLSDGVEWRCVVVDNGSADGLSAFNNLDPRVSVLRSDRNVGFGAGTNLAFAALGEVDYLLTLNPDVIVEPGTLATLAERLDADLTIGAATCRLLLPDGSIDPACRRSDPNLLSAFSRQSGLHRLFRRNRWLGGYNLTWLSPNRPHEVGCVTGALMLVRPEALKAAGGAFDERFFLYGEDLDLCRRIRNAGFRIRYEPAAWATHVKGSGQVRQPATTWHFYRAMWTYYRKWGFFRRNPLVLAPLALAIGLLGTMEILRNQLLRLLARLREENAGYSS